jgi:hypothetical protein
MKNGKSRLALSAFCILHFAFFISALANDLSVDRRTVRVGETVAITLSLENAFATVDEIDIPVRNLTISSAPSVVSEFSWINGTTVRRKIFRYLARATGPGQAVVGPLVIALPNGRRQSFPPIVLQVLPDRAAGSNDPATVLRELLATGRDPFFVVSEVDKSEAFLGEQVVVTWWLYNAASVQEWQIGAVPKLAEFWVEEIDVRSAQPTETLIGEHVMQRMPIRRVAIFPLQSGTLPVGSMEIEAGVMRRTSSGPFGLFEGSVADVSFSSAPLTLRVNPLPAGAVGSVVGDFALNCSKPRQKNGGPVLVDASLAGRGNVRAAPAPKFERTPQADVQVVERGATLDRGVLIPSMTRRWQYVLFPARDGSLAIPALTLPVFSPSAASNRALRCEGSSLDVTTASHDVAARVAASSPSRTRLRTAEIVFGAAAVALVALLIARVAGRRRRESKRVGQLIAHRSPAEIRDAVHARLGDSGIDVAALMRESSDRGEAYRALRSLLDGLEQDRIRVDPPEVRRRVRELLDSLQSAA